MICWTNCTAGRCTSAACGDHWQHDGLLDGESIYVDPRPAILETVIHELIHRRKPRMGERRVGQMARLLVVRMDEATKRKWWLAYRRVKRKGPAVDVED